MCFVPSSIYYLFLSFAASKDLRGEKNTKQNPKTCFLSFVCIRAAAPQPPAAWCRAASSALGMGKAALHRLLLVKINLSAGRGAEHTEAAQCSAAQREETAAAFSERELKAFHSACCAPSALLSEALGSSPPFPELQFAARGSTLPFVFLPKKPRREALCQRGSVPSASHCCPSLCGHQKCIQHLSLPY